MDSIYKICRVNEIMQNDLSNIFSFGQLLYRARPLCVDRHYRRLLKAFWSVRCDRGCFHYRKVPGDHFQAIPVAMLAAASWPVVEVVDSVFRNRIWIGFRTQHLQIRSHIRRHTKVTYGWARRLTSWTAVINGNTYRRPARWWMVVQRTICSGSDGFQLVFVFVPVGVCGRLRMAKSVTEKAHHDGCGLSVHEWFPLWIRWFEWRSKSWRNGRCVQWKPEIDRNLIRAMRRAKARPWLNN